MLALILFLLGGVIMLSAGLWLAAKTRNFIRRGAHTQGHYIDAQWRGAGGSRSTQYGEIEFQTAQGRIVHFSSRVGTLWQSQNVGKIVPVLYDPVNPERAVVNSFVELWMPAIILAVVGATWVITAAMLLAVA
jgi:hypothetical protein